MWATVLIWLIEFLINRFLKSNTELRSKLEQSIKREAEYKDMLGKLNTDIASLKKDIDEQQKLQTLLMGELVDNVYKIGELKKQNEEKLNEYREGIDALSDAIALRSEL